MDYCRVSVKCPCCGGVSFYSNDVAKSITDITSTDCGHCGQWLLFEDGKFWPFERPLDEMGGERVASSG